MIRLSVAMLSLAGCSSSVNSPLVVDHVPATKPSAEIAIATLYVAGMNQKLQIL
jgi:hypothetical protein